MNILCCDDHSHITRLVEFVLKPNGHQVHCACDGTQAWEIFLAQNPDFLITDFNMPGLSGIELAEKIRNAGSTIPIVMLTAQASDFDPAQLNSTLGIANIIMKPFSPRLLTATVNQFGAEMSRAN